MKFTDITPTQAQRYLNIATMEYDQHITKADKVFFDNITDAAIRHFHHHLEKYIVRDKNGNITHLQNSLAKLYKSVYLSEVSEVTMDS